MKILIADDQQSFLDLLRASVERNTDHEVVTATDGAQALELALGPSRPDVLILDWVMPKMTGSQVCRIVRGTPLDFQPYILFVTSRCRREELLQCLASGGDDLLTKPFAPDVLLARLEMAVKRTQIAQSDGGVEQALLDAQREQDGDLVVRSGDISARILFSGGKIAWIQLADSFGSLLDAMAPQAGIDAETAQSIVAECRRTGKGLGETLSSWGLVDGEQLRQITRTWLQNKLASLRRLDRPSCLFVPGMQRCSPELLFELEELLPESAPLSLESPVSSSLGQGIPSPRPSKIPLAAWASAFTEQVYADAQVNAVLERCMRGDGILGAAAIDRETGLCLGRVGVELNPDIVWAHLNMVNTIMRTHVVQDAHVSTEQHLHLISLVPSRPELLIYALVDQARSTIARARLTLRASVQDEPTTTRHRPS